MPRGPRSEKRAIMSVWDDFIHRLEQDLAECRRDLNSWNRGKCSIASARGMTRGSTQLNGKSIGTRKRLACTRVSYANFARNTEDSQMASELAFGRQRSRRRMLHCDRLRSHAFVWPSSLRLTE